MALRTKTPKDTEANSSSSSQKKPAAKRKAIAQTPRKQQLLDRLKAHWENLDHQTPVDAYSSTPGIYTNLTFEQYASIPAINFSSLKNLEISPAHFKHAPQRAETESLKFGNYVHTAVLEPEKLLDRYLVLPDFTLQIGKDPKTNEDYKSPKSTKAYKTLVQQFYAAHPDKVIVDLEEFNKLLRINKGIYANSDAAEILSTSINELSIVWEDPETQLLCKGRIDAVNHDYALFGDLKTTHDISDFDIGHFCYHQQQAHYQEGYRILTGHTYTPYIFAVEKNEPHSCRCGPIRAADLKLGIKEVKAKLRLIRECMDNRSWPGPSNPKQWSLSKWYTPYDGTY